MVWDLEELSYFWWNPHDYGLNYTDLFKEQQKFFFFIIIQIPAGFWILIR